MTIQGEWLREQVRAEPDLTGTQDGLMGSVGCGAVRGDEANGSRCFDRIVEALVQREVAAAIVVLRFESCPVSHVDVVEVRGFGKKMPHVEELLHDLHWLSFARSAVSIQRIIQHADGSRGESGEFVPEDAVHSGQDDLGIRLEPDERRRDAAFHRNRVAMAGRVDIEQHEAGAALENEVQASKCRLDDCTRIASACCRNHRSWKQSGWIMEARID